MVEQCDFQSLNVQNICFWKDNWVQIAMILLVPTFFLVLYVVQTGSISAALCGKGQEALYTDKVETSWQLIDKHQQLQYMWDMELCM